MGECREEALPIPSLSVYVQQDYAMLERTGRGTRKLGD
jgi:hypothetical protein